MRRILSLACLTALVCAAGPAGADSKGALDGQKIIVVPLGGAVPNVSSSATAKMSEKLLTVLRNAGARASMAQSSLDDLLMLNGCSFEQDKCLSGVARTLGVQSMFVGEVSGTDESDTRLVLRHVPKSGKVTQHEIALSATTEQGIIDEVGAKVAELYPPPAADAVKPPPDDRPDIIAPPPDDPPDTDDGGFSLGNVRGYTWIIAGGGLVAAAAGGVLLSIANGKQSDIDDHPTDTLADLQDLQDLEDSAETQFLIGDALLIGGGVVAAVGIGMVIWQASSGPSEERMVVSPVISDDTAGVTFTWKLD